MLENRFPRSPARHSAQRPGCGLEDFGAAGWSGGGPRPLSRRRGPSVFFHRATTCRRTPRAARAGTGYFVERRSSSGCADSRLGASGLPRPGTAPAGEAPPLTCSSASPGVHRPHEGCLQILNASSQMLELSVSYPLHTHTLLLNRKILIGNFLFHTQSLSPSRAPSTRDNLAENVATDPCPQFLSHTPQKEPSWGYFPGLFVLAKPISQPNKLLKPVYLVDFSERQKKKSVSPQP